nr:MAG TPA: TROVE domain [Caudoviricetes sp.]
MSKFNESTKQNLRTYEGGKGYKKDPAQDWLNFLFSSYMEDGFYESSQQQMSRFIDLTNQVGNAYGPEFVAKAAKFARNELGMRSVTHIVGAMVNSQKFEGKRKAIRDMFYRPDDVAETFAVIDKFGQKRSHAMVNGARDYLSGLDEYQIGKYKLNNKNYNMFDLINITHANSAAIDKYKRGTLENPDTWEVAISTASPEEKSNEWIRLVEEGKLGYLALIRNLRNIISAVNDFDDYIFGANWIHKYLVPQLTNNQKILKSKVFPYQIYCAYKNMGTTNAEVVEALDKAFSISCCNVPPIEGKSAVLLDVSGSMEDTISFKSNITIKEVGACYAAVLYIAQDADFVKFGNNAFRKEFSKFDTVFTIIEKMCDNENCGYGTDIVPAMEQLRGTHYDRIFIISDMQVMTNCYYTRGNPEQAYRKYCDGAEIYSFDLGNYSTQCFPVNDKFHYSTTLNDKVFEFIPFLENGNTLVDYINNHY